MYRNFIYYLSFVFIFATVTVSDPAMANMEYIVDEGDVIKIMVYGHDDLTTTVRVSGRGTIPVPLLDTVKVAGLTIPQISTKISAALADGYIISPQVNVFIDKFRAQNIFISGEVYSPGAYQYEMNMSLIKIVSLAGGFKNTASKDTVTISRKVSNQDVVILNSPMNEPILPGDVIIVKERFLQDIFVTGQVKKPGVYQFEEGLTLIKVITMAGGFSDIANKSKISITRKINDKESIISSFNLSSALKAGDVIIVPESFF